MPSIRASCSPAPPRRRLPPPTGRPSPRQPPEETTDGAPAAGAQSWRPLPHTGRRRRRGEERELRYRQGRNHGAGRRERLRQVGDGTVGHAAPALPDGAASGGQLHHLQGPAARSEERRVGKEGVSPVRFRGARYPAKKKNKK